MNIRLLNTRDSDFDAEFNRLFSRNAGDERLVEQKVREIISAVRQDGDAALLEYTRLFDRYDPGSADSLEVKRARIDQALQRVSANDLAALKKAAERIRRYHERQRLESWRYTDDEGTLLGQQITALERVGIYVPGGKAAYPSSVLMNAIPAAVAGVDELIMVVPSPDGMLNDLVLAAADIAGVKQIYSVGGAQAIGALAYGTDTIPHVDKIVGPGNIYVATAKRIVYGQVDIDMIAGPSEIVIVCDGTTDAEWVAMDLFSQAEHDEVAQAILISLDPEFTNQVQKAITRMVKEMERREIIEAALQARGALINAVDTDEAVALVNRIAPEHLELSIEQPLALAERVRHAGAIFLGRYTAEVLGDYCAGPNHVLPTSGTARFSSPLGVYDFQKRTSLIMCTPDSAAGLAKTASVLARGEGLTAHARSAEYRIKK